MYSIPNPTAYSPDDKLIVSSRENFDIQVWDVESAEMVKRFYPAHSRYVAAVTFNHQGTLIASAAHDSTVKVWRLEQDGPVASFAGSTNPVYAIIFSPDDHYLACDYVVDETKIWKMDTQQELTPNTPEFQAANETFDRTEIIENYTMFNPFYIKHLKWSSSKSLNCINIKIEGALISKQNLRLINHFAQSLH